MTCIVALAHKGKVYMGGDAAGVDTHSLGLTVRSDKKVFRNNEFVMGFTTSFRMGQLLQYAFVPPLIESHQDVFGFMVTDFTNAVRECFKSGGYLGLKDNQEFGGTFLIGFKGRLFAMHGDYQIAENVVPYAACGCGEKYAMGSFYASAGREPQNRVRMALEAAENFSGGVRGPFHYEILNS